MAHRKLQQEIDRVFKKINEGLEIFNTYYERHENCTNNPSQKDKLESDLKREVKKLQRLREQIKSWQSSAEVKDKDSLLEYRRSVEVAMEKYKAVEKASKEKAYSNNSLKRSEVLEPEEQERRDVSDYLSEKIEELERQYDQLQVELDKLVVGKKKRSGTSANEERKQELKGLQGRYRWHQQQMELALRLLANEELHPQNVRDIQDDISYFIESNQEPDFVEDETIYESLNLEANEAIAHEVAASFAAQMAEENEEDYSKDSSKVSKKEQRRLEREAKKAAKLAAVSFTNDSMGSTPLTSAPSSAMDSELVEHDQNSTSPSSPLVVNADGRSSTPKSSPSPSPTPTTSSSIPSTANTTNTHCQQSKPQTPLPMKQSSQLSHLSTENQGHTHIHQSLNGVTTSTLKPATVPAKPAGELKWAVAAAQALEKEKREKSMLSPALPKKQINQGSTVQGDSALNVASTASVSMNNIATANITTSTPTIANANISISNGSSSSFTNTNHLILHNAPDNANMIQPTVSYLEDANGAAASDQYQDFRRLAKAPASNSMAVSNKSGNSSRLDHDPIDTYISDSTDDELEEEPVPLQLDAKECERRQKTTEQLALELCQNFELLRLPIGIQDLIVGSLITENNLQIPDGKQGGFRNFRDICRVNRLLDLPLGLSPPQPLDACRCSEQWDYIRVGNITDNDFYPNLEDTKNAIYEKFRMLETFTLFYNYYYAYTPLEHEIAATILIEREWRVSKDGVTWFFREGQPKFTNELCEVADFKVFKLDDWTAMTKLNYTLDYSTLKTPPTLHSISGRSDSEKVRQGSVSYGQTLLEQLKQGSSAMKVDASH